ncbi:hypothetical protein HPB51_002805 [Rhipicephalus microplus]|uniref:Uncharacterized protein n=1 Tax=Rhipicephalus microplus TaxID=6941 RepID=A0A9J6EWZ1_RHIMP|nr:hypothetical protein HPB51_002805 [Rhipicephalus microplus]
MVEKRGTAPTDMLRSTLFTRTIPKWYEQWSINIITVIITTACAARDCACFLTRRRTVLAWVRTSPRIALTFTVPSFFFAVRNMSKDKSSSTGSSKAPPIRSMKREADGTTPLFTSAGQLGEATAHSETGSGLDTPGRGSHKLRHQSRSSSVGSIPSETTAVGNAERHASDDVRGQATAPSGSKTSFRRHQPPRRRSVPVSSSDKTSMRASKVEAKVVPEEATSGQTSRSVSKAEVKLVPEVAATGQTSMRGSKTDVNVVAEEDNVASSQVPSSMTPVDEVVKLVSDSEGLALPRLVTFAVAADTPRSQEDTAETVPRRGIATTDAGYELTGKSGTAEPSRNIHGVASGATTVTHPEPRRSLSTARRESNVSKSFLSMDSGEINMDNRTESPPAGTSPATSSAPDTTRSGPEDSSRVLTSRHSFRDHPVHAKRDTKAAFDFHEHPAAIGLAVFVAILFTVATILYSFVARDKAEELVPLCSTEDCTVHADILTANLNRSLDPCDDFRAYVCSAWSPRRYYREHVTSVMDDVIFSYLEDLSAVLRDGSAVLPAGEKAHRMYELCEQYFEDGGANVKRLNFILRFLNLSWPEGSEDDQAPPFFDQLMEVSLKWQVPFWISVRVLSQPDSSRGRLLIKPGDYVAIARNHHRRVILDGDYAKYLQGFYGTLSEDHTNPAETFFIEETKAVEGDILEQLYSCFVSKMKNPASFPLGDIGNYTANVPSEHWMRALQKYLSVSPQSRFPRSRFRERHETTGNNRRTAEQVR